MPTITITEAQKVKQRLYEEKRYLAECLRSETPDSIRILLECEIKKRNAHIDIIEAAIEAKEQKLSRVTINIPNEVIT